MFRSEWMQGWERKGYRYVEDRFRYGRQLQKFLETHQSPRERRDVQGYCAALNLLLYTVCQRLNVTCIGRVANVLAAWVQSFRDSTHLSRLRLSLLVWLRGLYVAPTFDRFAKLVGVIHSGTSSRGMACGLFDPERREFCACRGFQTEGGHDTTS
jgi:hypothetical protein